VDTKTFWGRLSIAMTERGHAPTQAAVGNLLSLKQSSIHKWEYGGLPRMRHSVQLAEKLGVTVEWLLTGRGVKRPLNEHETVLIELYRQLGDELERGEVFGRIREMLRRRPTDPNRPYV